MGLVYLALLPTVTGCRFQFSVHEYINMYQRDVYNMNQENFKMLFKLLSNSFGTLR